MIETTYICDRCKQSQQPRVLNGGYPPLWKIGIICEPIDYPDRYHPMKRQQTEWCRKCVDELHVMMPLIAADTPTPAPTIEDIIRNIVQQEQQGE